MNLSPYISYMRTVLNENESIKQKQVDQSEYANLLHEKETLLAQIETLKAQVASGSKEQVELLTQQLRQKDQILLMNKNEIARYKEENDHINLALNEKQIAEHNNQEKLNAFSAQIDALKSQLSEKERVLQDQNRSIAQYQSQLSTKQNEYNQLLQRYTDVQAKQPSQNEEQLVQRKDYYKNITKQLQALYTTLCVDNE